MFRCQRCQLLVGLCQGSLVSGPPRAACCAIRGHRPRRRHCDHIVQVGSQDRELSRKTSASVIAWPLLEQTSSEALESELNHRHTPRKPRITRDTHLAARLPGRSALSLMLRLVRTSRWPLDPPTNFKTDLIRVIVVVRPVPHKKHAHLQLRFHSLLANLRLVAPHPKHLFSLFISAQRSLPFCT